MNRFPSRAISLALAILFLLASAGIAFTVMFRGFPAFAADDDPVVDSISAKVAGDTFDLKKDSIPDGSTIEELVIEVTFPDPDGKYANSKKQDVSFLKRNFDISQNTGIHFGNPDTQHSGKTSFRFTITNVLYQELTSVCAFKINFTLADGTTSSISFEEDIETNASSGSYYFASASFTYNQRPIGKVERGSYSTFEVTINDSEVSYERFKAMDHDSFAININPDFITYSSKPEISSIRRWSTTGVSYKITFRNVYYVGDTTQMILSVDYNPGETNPLFQTRYFNEIIQGCEIYDRDKDDDDDDDDSSSSRPDIAPPTPNIIVSEFTYGGGTVTAASSFDLTIKFANTSKKLPVDNIVVKIGVPEAFTLTSSSNTFYIESLSREASVERTIGLSVKPGAEPISHPVKLSFTFEAVINEERKQFTSEQEISIPVSQLDRFSLNPVEVPSELYVGEDTSIEVSFVNKGKTPVYNVTAEISGNIAQPGQRQFIGNVESGKEDSADFLITPMEEGPLQGEVLVTYEDANMNVTELRSPFTANAMSMSMPPMDPDMDAMGPMEPGPVEQPWIMAVFTTLPPWAWMVGGVVLVIVLAFVIKVERSHMEKKLLLEDDDEDI